MTRGARKEGLSRRHRFVGRGGFAPALQGPRKLRGEKSLVHVAEGRPGVSRLGLALPKRLAPRAVDRNRAKRIARELFRRHAVKAAGLDVVVAPRVRLEGEAFPAWSEDLRRLLDRAAAPL